VVTDRPVLIDWFCGAGGAATGYAEAGFDVYGVDNEPHPAYPFPILVTDALTAFRELLDGHALPFTRRDGTVRLIRLADVAAMHGSPPCKLFTDLAKQQQQRGAVYEDLLTPFRALVREWGGPYVIENVESAPLLEPLTLCGSEFGLGAHCRDGRWRFLKRHRLFESNVLLLGAGGCQHRGQALGVYGDGGGGQQTRGYKGFADESRAAMGIDWMNRDDLSQSIPPAFSRHVGEQVLSSLEERAA
jgi:DNA (cytosine-5)-methyltransferase 1